MPDINYGEILEALNDKVDLDGAWGCPSSTPSRISMTLGQPGDTYTAPADGYFRCYMLPSSVANYWLYLENISVSISDTEFMTSIGYGMGCYVPVKKNHQVRFSWRADGTYNGIGLEFIYSQKTN